MKNDKPVILDDVAAAREGYVAPSLSDEQAEQAGAAIARLLNLKHAEAYADRYETSGGNKTNKGLARTILAIFPTQ